MAKRGIFRRLFDSLRGKQSPTTPKPPSVPSRSSSVPAGQVFQKPRGSLESKVINHIIAVSPLANRRRITDNIAYMDIDELEWTLKASPTQIAWRARQDADRLATTADGATIPMNPWWYR
jgi:hypothetical protein